MSSLFLSVETAGRDVVEDGTKGGDERDFMLISELCRCRVAGMPGAPGGSGIAHTGEKDKNEYASDSADIINSFKGK